jgi:catechol 2,3-dioxygenase-like lactoylglutathione lyase family enzyme
MPVAAMNHFTVLSDDLEATRRFYCDLFGFKVGPRPPFQFPAGGFMPMTTRRSCM